MPIRPNDQKIPIKKIEVDWDEVFDAPRPPPPPRIYRCSGCGKQDVWGPGWGWWGSWRQWDEDPDSLIYFCQESCWIRAMDNEGIPLDKQLDYLLRALNEAIKDCKTITA